MIAKLRVGEPPEALNEAEDNPLTVPVVLPEMVEIRKLAFALHAKGKSYEAEMAGWPVSYDPGCIEPPIDSKLTFTPALFFIGVWPLWYVSFTWEYGHDAEPNVLVGDEYVETDAAHAELEVRSGTQRFNNGV